MPKGFKSKSINFIEAYKQKDNKFIYSKSFKSVVLLLSLVFVLSGVYLYIHLQTVDQKKELKAINNYINDTNNINLYDQALFSENQLTAVLFAQKNNLLSIKNIMDGDAIFGKDDFKSFFDCAANVIIIKNFEYRNTTAAITFVAQTMDVTQIPSYIERLKATNLFSSIEYNGYEKKDDLNYSFNLTCYIKEVNTNE